MTEDYHSVRIVDPTSTFALGVGPRIVALNLSKRSNKSKFNDSNRYGLDRICESKIDLESRLAFSGVHLKNL